MRLYRLTRERDAAKAFDGTGSAECPGRWNVAGKPAVYTAASLSLAVLEVMVQSVIALWTDSVYYPIDIDDRLLERLDIADLAGDWHTLSGRDHCRQVAESWRVRASSVGLMVPSAVLPNTFGNDADVILNPQHPNFHRIAIGAALPLRQAPQSRAPRLFTVS